MNNAFQPTQQQIQAKELGLNISLSANAGTGKTTVLVDRYLELLDNGADVNEIAAITFTKKAASEMIERIVSRVDDKITELAQTNREKLYHYRKIRRQLINAKISTIHSFCIDIIKDYAIELNVEPNFRQLNSVEKFCLENETIARSIEEMQSKIDPTKTEDKYKEILFSEYERAEVEKMV